MLGIVQRFLSQRSAVIGALLVLALLAITVVVPLVGKDPNALDIDRGISTLGAPLPPSAAALLGTDDLGRDVWARLASGVGTSLWIAGLATLLALVIGVGIGAVAGLFGGRLDHVLMRSIDLVLAIPALLLAILLAALLRQSELATTNAPVIIPLAVIGWTSVARVIRSKARALAASEHVLAARALGATSLRILARHLLPNLAGVIGVMCAFVLAQNLLAESMLSYAGLGHPPPAPTLGGMLFEGRAYYRTAPWLILAPGTAIVLAVLAFNLLGEGLRQAFDPKDARR